MSLLQLKNFSLRIQPKNAPSFWSVSHTNLSMASGETRVLIGESGSGKSTFLSGLMGLLPEGSSMHGSYSFEGKEMSHLQEKDWLKIRGKTISLLLQDSMNALHPCRTVLDQMLESFWVHRPEVKKNSSERICQEMIERVGLDQTVLNLYPHQLSGGMKQRILLGMSIIHKPKLLLADEPTTALDPIREDQILKLLMDLKKDFAMGLILVSHDMHVVRYQDCPITVMYGGFFVEELRNFEESRHPYTEALISCFPKKGAPLKTIPGISENPYQRPQGCCFSKRCPLAFEPCFLTSPPMLTLNDHHQVACYRGDL